MPILIDKIRIKNFRALQNVEIDLKPITLLVGANNAGKTTLLRALHTVLGVSRNQLNKDDLFIDKNGKSPQKSIFIDIRIVPIDAEGQRINSFDDVWQGRLVTPDTVGSEQGKEFLAFRSEYTFKDKDEPETPIYTVIRDW